MRGLVIYLMVIGVSASPAIAQPTKPLKFNFGPASDKPGVVQIEPTTRYTSELLWGFDLGSKVVAIEGAGCSSEKAFFFSVDLPEGNFDVTVMLGDPKMETNATIRSESRRLMLENVKIAAGKVETRTFTANIRNSKLPGGGQVKLKDREAVGPISSPVLHWDDKLTLEFSAKTCVRAIEIAKNDEAITVFLAGDSTVTDQPRGDFYSWGQVLPRFFKPGVVAIANHAESGEATTSFIGARRLDKILAMMKKGDYLFIQFGHNDQNQKREVAAYTQALKRYLAEARKREATPVLVTPMHRRVFDGNAVRNSLGGYPDAVRKLAADENVTLIDLHAMSKDYYEALGPTDSKRAFVDNTHTNALGAYEFARHVAASIQTSDLGLAKHVIENLPMPGFKVGKAGS